MENAKIVLEDLFTGVFYNLLEEEPYQFIAAEDDRYERFLLHFNPVVTGVDDPDEQAVYIYAYGKDVYIKGNNFSSTAHVFIYDLYGREIVSRPLSPSPLNKISVNLNNAGIIVKTLDAGKVNVRKLFIQ